MRKNRFIRNLTIVTILVLLGIMILQVYWLSSFYLQQKSRFKADVQNALSTANVKTTMRKALMVRNNELLQALDLEGISDMIEQSKLLNMKQSGASKKMITLPVSNSVVKIVDTTKLLNYLKKALESGKPREVSSHLQFELVDSDIELYKAAYSKELISNEIFIPFELAVVRDQKYIDWSSCDSNTFRQIGFKTIIDDFSQAVPFPSYGLQAAFPDVSLYLLRKMIWVLSVSILLIVIGSCSLGYLLVFFFNHKKMADLRNDFMNNMTHELKTPISALSLALEMVLDKNKPIGEGKKDTYLRIAQRELKRLDALTESTLNVLSVEKAEINIVKTRIELLPWLNNIVSNLSPLSDGKNAQVTVSLKADVTYVLADKIHMTNVMYNIVENAIKYNNKKEPRVNITVMKPASKLEIEISDNGEGIPAEYIKNIFDKFFRVPKGNRHDVKGYGLGLSYVKGIIEMHAGSIDVKSTPDRGSTFIIHLPFI